MLISVQVYSCNHHYSIALACTLACTETGIKIKLKKRQEMSLKRTPAMGVMQMQKLWSLC